MNQNWLEFPASSHHPLTSPQTPSRETLPQPVVGEKFVGSPMADNNTMIIGPRQKNEGTRNRPAYVHNVLHLAYVQKHVQKRQDLESGLEFEKNS